MWLRPVYDTLREQLRKESVLHADETTLQVLKESGRSSTSKSYMWLYRTSGCAEHSIQHPMTKEHYISFVVYCTGERFESVKLYPESSIEVRFFSRGHGTLYWYCNHHGLFKKRI